MNDRKCSNCELPMTQGFCILGGEEYYCSKVCMEACLSPAEIIKLDIGGNGSNSYWTEWEDETPRSCLTCKHLKVCYIKSIYFDTIRNFIRQAIENTDGDQIDIAAHRFMADACSYYKENTDD